MRGCTAVFGIIIILSGITGYSQAQTLVLNDTNGPPFTTDAQDGFLDILVARAFAELGLQLKLVKSPAERGLKNANEGIDDGELTRIAGIDRQYPELVRVPEKLIDWEFVAFTRNRDIRLQGWQSLRDYSIGFIRGWKILEQNTAGFPYVNTVRNSDVLFSMLDKGRVDVILFSRWYGMYLLQEKNIQGVQVLEPPLAVREMFIYLNKRHARHVPGIAAALRQLKASGEYERLFNQTVRPIAASVNRYAAP